MKRPPSRIDEIALQVHTRVLEQRNADVRHVRHPNDAASITGKFLHNHDASLNGGKRWRFINRMVSRSEFPK